MQGFLAKIDLPAFDNIIAIAVILELNIKEDGR